VEEKGLAGPSHADDRLGLASQESGLNIAPHHFGEGCDEGVTELLPDCIQCLVFHEDQNYLKTVSSQDRIKPPQAS
jgi:hypothetical protein